LQGHAGLFPAVENIFAYDFEEDGDIQAQRIHILNQLLHDDAHAKNKLDIIVAPIQALLQPVPSPKIIAENILKIQRSSEYPLEELIVWLQKHHYQLVCQVENAGEYAVRGGIIDIFPFASETPYRIEYFGDEIDWMLGSHLKC